MNKAEIVVQLAAKTQSTKAQAERTYDDLLDIIRQALVAGEDVLLGNLGRLSVVDRAARSTKVPGTDKVVVTPACKGVKFTQFDNLKKAVNGQ